MGDEGLFYGLVLGLIIGAVVAWGVTVITIRHDAIKNGVAEYYIDNNSKKFRWVKGGER